MADEPRDAELWSDLRDLVSRVDPVPAAVLAAARGSLAWLDPDAALAELVADSLAVSAAGLPAGVRGSAGPRLLTFTAGALSIEVEASAAGEVVRLVGQVVPPQPARVRVQHGAGHVDVAADGLGRFAVDGIAAGPVRLRCETGDPASAVRTAWVIL